ncbi:hypothetical protein CLAFUW4_09159 [Fulvia fulva]|nr:hypothetical protein CLAFUR4_09165 [Fulvia fulva]KAK4615145.1 hypothetical protein CLAFUR0_09157 [Fulvia fulva]WPV19869.1 hypothetical protein CLAFUW4_09159 [Fulvia fulva]WPV35719.1 hypothetical protein CLAFUW7_09160 [Fulvia fulva]
MPPRLAHRKARTGCQRCKARKVKCDEIKPRCSACTRHSVSCEYVEPAPRRMDQAALSTPPQEAYVVEGGRQNETEILDARLEIRLMHDWTAYTCQSFSQQVEFWRFQAPLFAMDFRMVLDSMFGLAALHLSKQSASQYIPMNGRMVPIRDPTHHASHAPKDFSAHEKKASDRYDAASAVRTSNKTDLLSDKQRHEMLLNARKYFDRAIDGQHKGLTALTRENVEAVYITSILVSFHALFTLGEPEQDATLPSLDPIIWLRLAESTRHVVNVWTSFAGEEYLDSISPAFFGRGDLPEEEALYQQEAGKPFEALVTFAEDYESSTADDKDAFWKCAAYLALVYKMITEEAESVLNTCRRLVAMPSRLPRRFSQLVEAGTPRSLVMLAHAFALMKLISLKVPWFQGLAERQIPRIAHQLPPGWKDMMAWPSKVAEGKLNETTTGADIRDILSL